MIKVALSVLCFALAAGAAEDPRPPLAQIVERASQLALKKPDGIVCRVETEALQLDSGGKKEHDTRAESEVTFKSGERNEAVIRQWKDGKELTQRELAAQDKKRAEEKAQGKGELELKEPLEQPGKYRFALLREEELWGRRAYVLSAAPTAQGSEDLKGTLWIDANSFVELKAELLPANNPDRVDWMKVQLQAALDPSGAPVPTLVQLEGGGHFLLFRKGFRFTQRWSGCKAWPG